MLIPPEFTTPEFTTLTHILIISTNVKQKLNLKQNLTPHLSIAPITKDIHFTILGFILPTLACTTTESSTDSTDSTADTPHTPTSTTKDITTNNKINGFFYFFIWKTKSTNYNYSYQIISFWLYSN